MTVNYYREVDLVAEGVTPKENVTVSLQPKDNTNVKVTPSRVIRKKTRELIGDAELVDGISVRNPHYLTDYLKKERESLSKTLNSTLEKIDQVTSKYYNKEVLMTRGLNCVYTDSKSMLLPGLTYIGVAFMAGSIAVRNRNIALRMGVPILLSSVCFSYALPNTFETIKLILHEKEEDRFPVFTERQDRIVDQVKELPISTKTLINSCLLYTSRCV